MKCLNCRGEGTVTINNVDFDCFECRGTGEVFREVCPGCKGKKYLDPVWTYDDGKTKSGYYPKCDRCDGSGYL
ncbi:MAG: hypothetical protein LRZ84_22865 [Desertifilum sp.]|nr:hypothetical protein [Desertifilum sp.]